MFKSQTKQVEISIIYAAFDRSFYCFLGSLYSDIDLEYLVIDMPEERSMKLTMFSAVKD